MRLWANKPKYSFLLYGRFEHPTTKGEAIIELYTPEGEVLAAFPETEESWSNEGLRRDIYPNLRKIIDVSLTPFAFAEKVELSLATRKKWGNSFPNLCIVSK